MRRARRDLGLRPAYALYALIAFAAATALCMVLSRGLEWAAQAGPGRWTAALLGPARLLLAPLCYGGCTALCAAVFYRRRLAEALRLLEDASAQIAAGRLDFSLRYGREDEMGRLCRSFETMRSALAESKRAMRRQVEERSRLNAAFSHDLRTPLTVLKGHAGMLLAGLPRGELTEEEVLEEVRVMSLHIDRLESYVEAMARLRRLEDVGVRPVLLTK